MASKQEMLLEHIGRNPHLTVDQAERYLLDEYRGEAAYWRNTIIRNTKEIERLEQENRRAEDSLAHVQEQVKILQGQ